MINQNSDLINCCRYIYTYKQFKCVSNYFILYLHITASYVVIFRRSEEHYHA